MGDPDQDEATDPAASDEAPTKLDLRRRERVPAIAPHTRVLGEDGRPAGLEPELPATPAGSVLPSAAPETTTESTLFGRFLLGAVLGRGGMAEVRAAVDLEQGAWLAACVVKQLLPEALRSEEARAMFRDEARIATQLHHPNIVEALDAGEIDGAPFIAFRALDAITLWQLARPDPLSQRAAAEIGIAVAGALEYAHGLADAGGRPLELVHRDVSATNVLLLRTGEVKLVDFGIARYRGREHSTRMGTVKGTRRYMAPEQMLGRPSDRRADLFSLGAVLAESLGALEPVPETRPSEVRADPGGLDPRLHGLLLRLTAERAEDRPSSAREVRVELESMVSSLSGPDLASRIALAFGPLLPLHLRVGSGAASPAVDAPRVEEEPGASPSLSAMSRLRATGFPVTDETLRSVAQGSTVPPPPKPVGPPPPATESAADVLTPARLIAAILFGIAVASLIYLFTRTS